MDQNDLSVLARKLAETQVVYDLSIPEIQAAFPGLTPEEYSAAMTEYWEGVVHLEDAAEIGKKNGRPIKPGVLPFPTNLAEAIEFVRPTIEGFSMSPQDKENLEKKRKDLWAKISAAGAAEE